MHKITILCGHQVTLTSNIFANLEKDAQDLDSLSDLINDCFLEPMRDYESLPDNIFTPTENDIPISLSEEVCVFLNSVNQGSLAAQIACPIRSCGSLQQS